MLSKIFIEGLYGLHSYELDLHPEKNPYLFVTGPNAYGKTSLLRMLSSLYNLDFRSLSDIVFDKFGLGFDDGFKIDVTQRRFYANSEDSDEVLPQRVELTFVSGRNISAKEEFLWASDQEEKSKLNNMTAYLASHPIYMIMDNRLYMGGSDASVGDSLQAKMRGFLQDLERKLNAELQKGMLEEQDAISEELYGEKMSNLQPMIDSIIKYGLVGKSPIPAYSKEKAAFCHSCLVALENALQEEVLDGIAKLNAFFNIIENYAFAKKRLELSPYYGFRFKAEDEMSSILSFEQLSSGERHIVLMNYDILFDVADEALVLVDEPELSLHLEWQGQFLENLNELTGVRRDLQFVICTHAPEMFGYDWALSVDLYEQAK